MSSIALKPVIWLLSLCARKAIKNVKVINEKKDKKDIELQIVTNKIKAKIEQAQTLKSSDPVPSQDDLLDILSHHYKIYLS